MFIIRVVTTFCFATHVCIAQELKLFERDSQTDGYECHVTDSRLLATHESYIHCAAHCQTTNRCKRMFYDAGTKQCVGCSTILYQLSGSAGSLSYISVSPTKEMSYLGCFVERSPRVLPNEQLIASSMTNEKCFQHCIIDHGYRYAGTQARQECYCGDTYEAYALLPDSECIRTCAGDDAQICGGPCRLSIYSY